MPAGSRLHYVVLFPSPYLRIATVKGGTIQVLPGIFCKAMTVLPSRGLNYSMFEYPEDAINGTLGDIGLVVLAVVVPVIVLIVKDIMRPTHSSNM